MLSDFPEAKRYLEYEDYTAHSTVQNASELITTIIERHADVIGNRQNFVGYMAMRPGVEKRGAHGLFNDSDGYLPQDVKRTVDDIITELAKDKQVSQLDEKWCELERLKYKIYTQREPELPPLADNKVFKPVKNMIIRAVLHCKCGSTAKSDVPGMAVPVYRTDEDYCTGMGVR